VSSGHLDIYVDSTCRILPAAVSPTLLGTGVASQLMGVARNAMAERAAFNKPSGREGEQTAKY
jgi:hypothetical protein